MWGDVEEAAAPQDSLLPRYPVEKDLGVVPSEALTFHQIPVKVCLPAVCHLPVLEPGS